MIRTARHRRWTVDTFRQSIRMHKTAVLTKTTWVCCTGHLLTDLLGAADTQPEDAYLDTVGSLASSTMT